MLLDCVKVDHVDGNPVRNDAARRRLMLDRQADAQFRTEQGPITTPENSTEFSLTSSRAPAGFFSKKDHRYQI
jgi:hypothetical protein